MASRLDKQIIQLEQDLKLHKLAVQFHSQKIVAITRQRISTPTALCCAFGAGFLVGDITNCSKQNKVQGQKRSRFSLATKVLKVVAGVQTINSFAKHL